MARRTLPKGAKYLATGRIKITTDGAPAPDGTRRQTSTTVDTIAEADRWLAEVRASIANGTYINPTQLTVTEFLDDHLESKRRSIKESTYDCYIGALLPFRRLHGDRRLQSIVKRDVELMVTDMLSWGKSPRTVNLSLTVLGAAFKSAVREGMLHRNVVDLVAKLKQTRIEMAIWSPAQGTTFLESTRDRYLSAGFVLSSRGLRRGEVLGLRWSDVDFEAGTLTIVSTRVAVRSEVITTDPKSERSRQVLPLTDDVLEVLREARVKAGMAARRPGALVVTTEFGEPIRPEYYSDLFSLAAGAAGLPVIRLHDLRHTSVTTMLNAGIPLHIVAAWHGHDPAVALRTYGHAIPSVLATAGAALPSVAL